jgi:phosphoglucomutase
MTEIKKQEYVKWEKNKLHVEKVQSITAPGELSSLFTRLEFGTAGLRGPMGAGYNHINNLVICQTTQGLCRYLIRALPVGAERGVVIGYDHRHNSYTYAMVTAAVFSHFGFKVFIYPGIVHTPLVPFGVGYFKASCGVMITASHNPKQDNGYKLYWDNGVQIIPPHDALIQESIDGDLKPVVDLEVFEEYGSVCVGRGKKGWKEEWVDASVCEEAYYDSLKTLVDGSLATQDTTIDNDGDVKVCYTAMHGVGLSPLLRAISHCNTITSQQSTFPHLHVYEPHAKPDPEFGTIKFPNPEEVGVLDDVLKEAERVGCKLVIANDPDADRFAMAEWAPENGGKWKIFDGNEIGVILVDFLLQDHRSRSDITTGEKQKIAVLTTAVSSGLLHKFAAHHNLYSETTLTGFKYIGNAAMDCERKGYFILFGYEEAIGYMPPTGIKDKDGISTAVVVLRHIKELYRRGETLGRVLERIEKEICSGDGGIVGKWKRGNGYVSTFF